MNTLKSEILRHLRPLIGLRLSIARRAADMRNLHFGEVRRTARGSVADYRLHVQCAWRIEGPDGVITGRADLWEPADIVADIDWDNWDYEKDENYQDRMMGELMRQYDAETRSWVNMSDRLVVEAIDADEYGGASLQLSGGFRIVIFPDGARGEHWRFISDDGHFVVGGDHEWV